MLSCNIVKDLLPLYADNVCSEESKKEIEAHIKTCASCLEELKLFTENEEQNSNINEDAAFHNFNKMMMKSNFKKVVVSTAVALTMIIIIGLVAYVPAFSMKWTEGLATVNIPVDGGLDIHINAKNYKNAYASYEVDEQSNATVYITVEQNLISKIFAGKDDGDRIVRIGNGICASFKNVNNEVQFFLPENTTVTEIYYVQADRNTLHEISKDTVMLENKILLWSK